MGEFLRIGLQAFTSEAPPTEFRLLSAGSNLYQQDGMSEPGELHFDASSGAQLLSRWESRGRKKMAIDYDHATFNPGVSKKLAAGWFVPEVRGDELWASQVTWTKQAAQHIADKEYLYYSPTIECDAKARVVGLRPVALTNDPALFNLRPLIQASATSTEPKMKLLLKALDLEEGADEAVALSAVQPLKDLKAQILALSGKANIAEALGAITAMKANAEKVETLSAQVASLAADKDAAEVSGLLDEAIRDGRIAPAKRDEFAGLVKSAGVAGLKACLSAMPKAKAPAIEAKDEKAPVAAPVIDRDRQTLLSALGLTPDQFSAHEKKHRDALAVVLARKDD